MKTLRWPLVASVTASAMLLSSLYYLPWISNDQTVHAQEKPPAEDIASADEISNAFRYVSRKAIPAVVSIEAVGAVARRQMTQLPPGFDDESFQNHPFLREFFDRVPREEGPGRPRTLPERRTIGQGSGFIIDPSGIVMTNAHVVRGAEQVKVQLSDGRVFVATDVKLDERADVAIIRIKVSEELPFLVLGNDEEMEIGDWVLAFGSPFGLHRTVTQGIISAKSRGLSDIRMRQEFIQTDAAINPGNSGGPLVNLKGEVIGINTAISTSSGGYDGVGFAVPVSLAKWVGDQLKNDGRVRRAYIGVLPQDIDADIATALSLPTPSGVLIAEVTKDSPADRAGLQIQDAILELAGYTITNSRKLMAVAEKLTIGNSYPVTILRNGRKMAIELTVAEFPDQLAATAEEEPTSESDSPASPDALSIKELGVDVQPLTPELAGQLNIPADQGVVISSVHRGSFASRLGIQPGHVIMRIGNTVIKSMADVKSAIEEAREQQQVLLFLKTPNGSQFISVPFISGE